MDVIKAFLRVALKGAGIENCEEKDWQYMMTEIIYQLAPFNPFEPVMRIVTE